MGLAENLAQITVDTGKLHNVVHGTIGQVISTDNGDLITVATALDQITNFNPRGNWTTSTAYLKKDLVIYDSVIYVVIEGHTSGTFVTDLGNGLLATYQDVQGVLDVIADLASTDEGKGVDLVGRAVKYVNTIDDLRTTLGSNQTLVYIKGHTSSNDGGQGFFYWNSSSTATDNDGTIIKVGSVTTGRWIRLYKYLNPDFWGAYKGGTSDTDSRDEFQAMSDAASNGAKFVFPPKTYYINGDIEFNVTNYSILMHGSTIVQKGINNITLVLNSDALQDESIIKTNISVEGGWLINNTGYASNSNIGIDTRGVFDCRILGVRFIDFGEEAIRIGARDSLWIRECSFYNNNVHMRQDEWATAGGNPQLIYIDNCVTTVFGTAGILIDSCANDFHIKNTSFIGSDSIVIYTGSTSTGSLNVAIENCSFEQGTTGQYYIRTQYENSKNLRNISILKNTFQDSSPHAIQLEAVTTSVIAQNKFNSNVDGVIDIDVNCVDINIGPNEFAFLSSFTQGISYACQRKEIKVYPSNYIIDSATSLTGWSGATLSTSTGTIDMSSVIGTYWTNAGKLIPPKAWILQLRCRDSASSSSTARFLAMKNNTISIADAQGEYLQGVTNNVYRTTTIIVPCDDNGDIYYDAVGSGASTLEVRLTLIGYYK